VPKQVAELQAAAAALSAASIVVTLAVRERATAMLSLA
jgi:hypothetical protein